MDSPLADDVRTILRELLAELGATSARVTREPDERSGVPGRTLPLGGGEAHAQLARPPGQRHIPGQILQVAVLLGRRGPLQPADPQPPAALPERARLDHRVAVEDIVAGRLVDDLHRDLDRHNLVLRLGGEPSSRLTPAGRGRTRPGTRSVSSGLNVREVRASGTGLWLRGNGRQRLFPFPPLGMTGALGVPGQALRPDPRQRVAIGFDRGATRMPGDPTPAATMFA